MTGWDDLRVFHALVRSGSLTAAAADLGLATPTVRRRLDGLEHRLGARLFDRLATGYRLTEAGRAIADRAEVMAECARAVEDRVRGEAGQPEGVVSITASEGIGAAWLAPRLIELHRRHPGLTVELDLGIARRDLRRGEADLALRLGDPADDELVGRRIGFASFGLYAAPGYLRRHGEPREPADLARHRVIESAGPLREVPQARALRAWARGARAPVAVGGVFAQHAAAVSGLGLAPLPAYLAADGPLRRVLPGFQVDVPVWLLTRRDLRGSARVRAVCAFVVDTARRTLPQEAARPGPDPSRTELDASLAG